ncbi:MAG: hypothetical protein WCI49_11755 [Ferruginibacter sp.]
MWEAFKQYLQQIKPTRNGMLAILLALVLIPAIADLFLVFLAVGTRHRESFFMTPFMLLHSVGFIPLLGIYLMLFFIIAFLVKQIFEKKS